MIKNLILIDTSYTLFHRYFATLRWLSLAHNDIYKEYINNVEYNWIENKIFSEKYEKLYIEGIIKLVGKKVYKNCNIIFCMDTPKEQVWRTELKCDYKGDRFDMSQKTNLLPTFRYTYNTIIPNLLKNNNNMFKMKLNKLEADDIIATICNYLKKTPEQKIYLISGDEDFKQLGRPYLYFLNFKTKKPLELTIEDAKISLHKKILLGDKSDCIKSIFPPRFPTKTKKLIVESIEEFNNFIKINKELLNRYNENVKLIDFNFIPKTYIDLIISEFTKCQI